MKYRVMVKACDGSKADKIAAEIAAWSGTTKRAILNALEYKDICIRKGADKEEAFELQERFEKVGAVVELEPVKTFRDEDETDEIEDEEGTSTLPWYQAGNDWKDKAVGRATSYRVGARFFHSMGTTSITGFISFILCFIILIYTLSALNKLAERNYKSIKRLESITVEVPVPVQNTTSDEPCDTVYIIDGQRFKKAD